MGVGPRRGERSAQQQYHALLIALLLTAFALSGFGAGLVTRTVTGHVLSPTGAPTSTSQAHPPQATSSPVAVGPASTSTAVATALAKSGFTLRADISSKSLTPGEQFTIVVTAVAADSTPVVGLSCFMRARTDGTPALYQEWPSPQVTDSDGHATWTLAAPHTAPGAYGLEVVAYGEHSWTYHYDVSVTILGANG